jgi:hypothetical protein
MGSGYTDSHFSRLRHWNNSCLTCNLDTFHASKLNPFVGIIQISTTGYGMILILQQNDCHSKIFPGLQIWVINFDIFYLYLSLLDWSLCNHTALIFPKQYHDIHLTNHDRRINGNMNIKWQFFSASCERFKWWWCECRRVFYKIVP